MRDWNYYKVEYEDKRRSLHDIADEWETYPNKIRREIKKLGFKLRDHSEAQSAALANGRHKHPTKGKSRPENVKAKIGEGMSENWKGISKKERKKRIKKVRSTLMTQTTYDPRLNTLSKLCVGRLDELFNRLDVDLTISGNKYIGNCPIHGNSDSGSFNLYYDGYSVPGFWKCRSKHCQDVFKPNIIGFARGRLSNLELDYHWEKNPKAIYPFPKTLNFLCDFLKVKLNSIKIDPKEEEKRRFIAECSAALNSSQVSHKNIKRRTVQKNLIIPAKYFVERGYSNEVLRSFDIGMAKISKRETENRVIVPIYNEEDYLIGYTCRSIFGKCSRCQLFHSPEKVCPKDKFEESFCSKWRHVDFHSDEVLYNFYQAKPHIIKTNSVVLVEGPADVWRLAENGIKNVVALFGNCLSDAQERLLASAQCMTIIAILDNDHAGRDGAKLIKEKYGRLFRMYFPTFDGEAKDVGELNSDSITSNIKPVIDKIVGLYK